MPPPAVHRSFWMPLVIGIVCAALLILPVIGVNRWEHTLPQEMRLVPSAVELRDLGCLLPLLSLFVFGALIHRGWPVIKTVRRGSRALLLALVILLQLAFVYAAMVSGVFTQRDWLFGKEEPFLVRASPDGQRTAYLSRSCFLLCSLHLHVQDGTNFTMQQVERVSSHPSTKAEIAWRPDSSSARIRVISE